MRLLVLSLAVWSVAAVAEAAPRNGPQQKWDLPQSSSGGPWNSYKPYAAYGEGSKSLTPKSGPQYYPG